jgi:hypothetical protein
MATNADDNAADDSKQVTADELRAAKYGEDGVDTSKEEDETDESDKAQEESEEAGKDDGQTDDQAEDAESEETDKTESAEDKAEFVKEFPYIRGDTPEEYAKNLEAAYKNSTAEALRLKGIAEAGQTQADDGAEDTGPIDPRLLYLEQMLDKDVIGTYNKYSERYPQLSDPVQKDQFANEAAALSEYYLKTKRKLLLADELYSKTAAILGWEPADKVDGKDRLAVALKDNAATSKSTNGAAKKPVKSKVTDAMIAVNRLMYPGKTDAEIRAELEPHVK